MSSANALEELKKDVSWHLENLGNQLQSGFRDQRIQDEALQRSGREEWSKNFHQFDKAQARSLDQFRHQLTDFQSQILKRLDRISDTTHLSLKEVRTEVAKRIEDLQRDNHEQLEKMRETVDEKLHKTLEERLGHSFKLVQESLDKVQLGLGEMQALASGVGDLKKVLSNVKTRGTLGEIQLGNILEQLLTAEQYAINVATIPNSANHVEFAIRFPGQDKSDAPVWLPIDSKFPMDRYEALVSSYEDGDADEIDRAHKDLVKTIKGMAKDIREKYIEPPHTTEFGILFLPVEGLYAEVARQPGLLEELQRDHRILIAGPSNLAAFLNSLQMGFRSIAIEKRSSEVWKILGKVKTEFGKFGDVLDRVQRQLSTASNTIEKVGVRSRAIEKSLRDVEELPTSSRVEELPQEPFS